MKRKLVCLFLATSIMTTAFANVTVYGDSNSDTEVSTKSGITIGDYVYNTPIEDETIDIDEYDYNEYLSNTGIYRGDYQRREVIPYVLKKGETVTLSQTSGEDQLDLTVELKTGSIQNDVEGVLEADGSELELTARDESVIYIKVPAESFDDVTVEYSLTEGTSLPIYELGYTDEDEFFDMWDLLSTKNAILESESFIMQVPDINKEYLRNLEYYGDFENLDHLLNYYEDMVSFYDEMIGLDYDDDDYDEITEQKYLVVPELRDYGTDDATYSKDIVRIYGDDTGLEPMFDNSDVGRDVIAKGYNLDFLRNDYSVDGAWDGVLAHYYAMEADTDDNTYATDYEKYEKANDQLEVYNKYKSIQQTGTGTEYTPEFFIQLFDMYGEDMFTDFNQEYRYRSNNGTLEDMSNTDIFVKWFSDYAEKDLSPYFLSYGFDVDSSVIDDNLDLYNVFYLNDIVSSQDKLDYIEAQYDVASQYGLVDTGIFNKDSYLEDITGDAVVQIDIDDVAELQGKSVLLKNGKYEYYADIRDGVANFDDIPVGVYNVCLPLTNSGDYNMSGDQYAVVSENGSTTINAKYNEMQDNALNLEYNFTILTDDDKIPLSADLTYESDDNYNLRVETYDGVYNTSDTSNDVYAYLKVYDDTNDLVATYDFRNNSPSTQTIDNIDIKKGYSIHLYREDEPEQKYYKSLITGEKYYDDDVDLMVFTIDDDGLTYLSGRDYSNNILSDFISDGKDDYFDEENQYYNTKERVYLQSAINHLDENDQAIYNSKYSEYLRKNNPELNLKQSQLMTKTGREPDYLTYATATDTEDGTISSNYITVDTSDVNLNKAGYYDVIYRVEDSDHNFTEETVSLQIIGDDIDDGSSGIENGDYSVEIEGRAPYNVRRYNVNSKYSNVLNKNMIVPYFVNSDGEKEYVEFSTYDETTGEVVYIDFNNTTNYNYEVKENTFTDIPENYWGQSSIDFVTSRDILTGVSDTQYSPKTNVNRAMIATVLARLSGADTSQYENTFEDVPDGGWYTDAVSWAKANGIMNGVDDTHFNPIDDLNREEFALTIYNFLNYMGYDISVGEQETFADDSDISSWAKDAVYTLKGIGIVNGDTNGNYNPKSNLTRAELATMLERLVDFSIDVEESYN